VKNGVKNIQAAAYNGARTEYENWKCILPYLSKLPFEWCGYLLARKIKEINKNSYWSFFFSACKA
jgi:hypothetical protein